MKITLLRWLHERFNRVHDIADPTDVMASVDEDVRFWGISLRVLLSAILVASSARPAQRPAGARPGQQPSPAAGNAGEAPRRTPAGPEPRGAPGAADSGQGPACNDADNTPVAALVAPQTYGACGAAWPGNYALICFHA